MLVRDNSGNNTYNSISHNGRRQFATSQYIVSDTDFLRYEMFADTVINSLKMPAKNYKIFSERQRISHRLVKLFTIRSCENDLIILPFGFQSINAALYRFYLHNHSGKTTKRIIIHPTVFIFSIITKVMNMYFCKPFILSTFHYRAIEEAFNHFRQNSNDINTHIFYFFRKNSVS